MDRHGDAGNTSPCLRQLIPVSPVPYSMLVQILVAFLEQQRQENLLKTVDPEAYENTCDIVKDLGQVGTEVETLLRMSHNILTRAEEPIQ